MVPKPYFAFFLNDPIPDQFIIAFLDFRQPFSPRAFDHHLHPEIGRNFHVWNLPVAVIGQIEQISWHLLMLQPPRDIADESPDAVAGCGRSLTEIFPALRTTAGCKTVRLCHTEHALIAAGRSPARDAAGFGRLPGQVGFGILKNDLLDPGSKTQLSGMRVFQITAPGAVRLQGKIFRMGLVKTAFQIQMSHSMDVGDMSGMHPVPVPGKVFLRGCHSAPPFDLTAAFGRIGQFIPPVSVVGGIPSALKIRPVVDIGFRDFERPLRHHDPIFVGKEKADPGEAFQKIIHAEKRSPMITLVHRQMMSGGQQIDRIGFRVVFAQNEDFPAGGFDDKRIAAQGGIRDPGLARPAVDAQADGDFPFARRFDHRDLRFQPLFQEFFQFRGGKTGRLIRIFLHDDFQIIHAGFEFRKNRAADPDIARRSRIT